MNYTTGEEVKLRDYVYLVGEGGRILQLDEEHAAVKVKRFGFTNQDTVEWIEAGDLTFNMRGAPDPTGTTEVFLIKKWGWRVVLKMDTSLIPDESFRENFYDFHTLKQMAEHFVWNRYRQGFSGQVEGFYEEQCEPPYTWVILAEKTR